MPLIFTTILKYVGLVIPVLPQLIASIEQLWKGTPKAGASKWIAIEQALSGTISTVANQVALLAPPGTKIDTVSAAIAIFTKTVNDALVKLFNDLGIFTTT